MFLETHFCPIPDCELLFQLRTTPNIKLRMKRARSIVEACMVWLKKLMRSKFADSLFRVIMIFFRYFHFIGFLSCLFSNKSTMFSELLGQRLCIQLFANEYHIWCTEYHLWQHNAICIMCCTCCLKTLHVNVTIIWLVSRPMAYTMWYFVNICFKSFPTQCVIINYISPGR